MNVPKPEPFPEFDEFEKQEQELNQKMNDLNKKLQNIQSIGSIFSNPSQVDNNDHKEQDQSTLLSAPNLENLPSIDSVGRIILTNEQIHENYNNSFPIIREASSLLKFIYLNYLKSKRKYLQKYIFELKYHNA